MKTRWRAPLARLLWALKPRLQRGAVEYGNKSWERPASEIMDEIEQELLDVVGWAVIARERIQELHRRLHAVERSLEVLP
jgi:hypothetical protein